MPLGEQELFRRREAAWRADSRVADEGGVNVGAVVDAAACCGVRWRAVGGAPSGIVEVSGVVVPHAARGYELLPLALEAAGGDGGGFLAQLGLANALGAAGPAKDGDV